MFAIIPFSKIKDEKFLIFKIWFNPKVKLLNEKFFNWTRLELTIFMNG